MTVACRQGRCLAISASSIDLRDHIRDVPDFPRPGIVFKDLTPLLLDPRALGRAVDLLAAEASGRDIQLVVASEPPHLRRRMTRTLSQTGSPHRPARCRG